MNRAGTESLTFHVQPHERITWTGWAVYHSPEPALATTVVRLRFGLRGEHQSEAEIRELWASAEHGAGDLGGQTLRALPWSRLEAAVNQPAQAELRRWLMPETASVVDPPPLDQSKWQRRPPVERQRAPRLRVRVPDDFRKPDSFYAEVADRFMQLIVFGEDSPAEQIANANPGVNVSTVHRWIKEARNRGLLPAAPRGEKRGNR